MRAALLGVLVLGLLVLGMTAGCTQVVDVADYTFLDDPCGPAPPSCEGSGTLSYVVVGIDTARPDAMGRRYGFDLDGTSDRVCGQSDFTTPTGETGIDNQLSEVIELYESLTGGDIAADNRASFARGEDLTVMVITGYDGDDDDCVTVAMHGGRMPAGMTADDLDADGDGELDANLVLDYGPVLSVDESACVIDGEVHAAFPPSVTLFPGFTSELRTDRARARFRIDETRVTDMTLGLAVLLEDVGAVLPPEALEFLRARADIAPSRRDARDCVAISSALRAEAVPVQLGRAF